MEFGPLELQACGENNFTMKALGQLAFREDLRRRFVRKLFGSDVISDDEPSTILFFSRIGLNFFREAIEREATLGEALDMRLNATLGLPSGFKWRRNADGKLTQPSQWSSNHIQEMLANNHLDHDGALRTRLADLQDVMNTEPDMALHWGKHLGIVEIKVLSPESAGELRRQQDLAEFLTRVFGWEPHLALIGPDYGPPPSVPGFQPVRWSTVASWFMDEPQIAAYIQSFAFFYRGQWRSMVQRPVNQPGTTAVDVWRKQVPIPEPPAGRPSTPEQPTLPKGSPCSENKMHFCHLGKPYFQAVFQRCWTRGCWPVKTIATGKAGRLPYKDHPRPGRVNWMAVSDDNRSCTNRDDVDFYDSTRVIPWAADEIAAYFRIDLDAFADSGAGQVSPVVQST